MSFLRELFTRRFTKDLILSGVFIFGMYGITHNPIVRPMPAPTPGDWSIQLMQHPLLFGLAGHNYLALRDQNGTIVQELHGLATDSTTGAWKYVGTNPTDLLQVWQFSNAHYYLAEKNFPGVVVDQGTQSDVLAVWNKAVACKDPINNEKLSYPPYGVSFRAETINSNSVAYTLARCMGFDIRHIGILTPGETKNLLPNN
jgi:hypothetical protein